VLVAEPPIEARGAASAIRSSHPRATSMRLAISADYVHTFFDVYLNGAPAAALTSLTEKYQEVNIEGR
jgi:hypothetical protein